MSNRKFCAFLFALALAFLAVSVSGCGGGGGSGENQPGSSTYTVTFNSNGGTPVPSVTVAAGSTLNTPTEPSKDANIFINWYKEREFSDPFMFGESGDKVSRDITLHAQWIPDDPAGFAVDDAIAGVSITYAQGDNPSYVSQNLGLTANSQGLPITWTSTNPGVVSSAGNVARPSGTNARVILTASAVSGDFSASKSFDLTVIRARSNTPEQARTAITSINASDIELMNASNDTFEITYSGSDDVVRAVDGQFTSLKVENADDALDAVQSVHDILGINNPYSETKLLNVAKDEYGAQYSFSQIYTAGTAGVSEDIQVYGRTITVSANASGDTDFLTSNICPTEKMGNVYTRYTAENANSAALGNYTGVTGLEVVSSDTRKIIYSLGRYENNPVMAFKVHVTRRPESGDVVDDTVIVSGVDLSIIRVMTNIVEWTVSDYGTDELGVNRKFPVTMSFLLLGKNLRDSGNPEVRIYNADTNHPVSVSYNGRWTDRHQISAYTNMRTILKWWKDTFNRNSLDNKGMTVKIITHDTSMNDNACWRPGEETIGIGNISDTTEYNLTRAIGLDTLTHETTHAVMYYSTGGIPYQSATGAIDDGYADLFGCLRDQDWRHGWRTAGNSQNPELGITYFIDKTRCLRDATENVTVNSISKIDWNEGTLNTIDDLYNMYKTVTPSRYGNDNNSTHFYCRLITHAAYLMHQDSAGSNGLTWYELGRVWYKSFTMGLDATSDFHTVRRNILRAAQQLRLSDTKLRTIRRAFDEIGVYGQRGTIKGRVRDYLSGGGLEQGGASVVIRGGKGLVETSGIISPDETFSFKVDTGNYTVQVAPTWGTYRTYQTRASVVSEGDVVNIRAELVKTGTGSLDVYVRNSSGAIVGATLRLTNKVSGSSYSGTSNNSGRYVFMNIPSGYYTLRLSKSGYDNVEIETAVPPSRITYMTLPLSVSSSTYQYKAFLYLGNRDYLAPHLKGTISGTLNFHVEEGNTSAQTSGGREAARYDSMTSAGFKWITFTNFSGSSYKFYVKWDGTSDVDWNNSGAVLFLYYNNRLVEQYRPPYTSSKGQYWEVFKIGGIGRKTINEIKADEPGLN